jgi:predicted nucleic acid-binding Zn ribbon protein
MCRYCLFHSGAGWEGLLPKGDRIQSGERLSGGGLVAPPLTTATRLSRLRARRQRVKFPVMAVYVYETIPRREGDPVRSYEIRQSMKDAALTKHPETGEPIRRVITGGLGIMTSLKGGPAPRPSSGGHCCGGGCGCH